MIIDLKKQDLKLLYKKAESGFKSCIRNPDNAFLQTEIDTPLEAIKFTFESVKIVFFKENIEDYTLETNLRLSDKNDSWIGKYVYVEDNEGNAIDDFLIFN